MYNKVTREIINKLTAIVGGNGILYSSEKIEDYSHDKTKDLKFHPDVVLMPETTLQVSQIIRLANEILIPVTPRAGGTGLSGGAVPVCGGILLSVEKMNKILEIDTKNLIVVCEPGVITQVLQEEVEKYGLYYPPDPASRGSCMLGGNVAECAGGPHALKYGVTRDYVLGLECVTPTGNIINTGGKLFKNSTGYNLTQLLVGSEGTLAIITKMILKLIPLPGFRKTAFVGFDDLAGAVKAVNEIFLDKIIPCACEFLDKSAMKAIEKYKSKTFPISDCQASLLIEVDGNDLNQLEKELEKIGEICLKNSATDVVVAGDSEKRNFLWEMRECVSDAVGAISTRKSTDTVVPRAKLHELINYVKEIGKKYSLEIASYGHIGDGNVHVSILKMEMAEQMWQEVSSLALDDLYTYVISFGGQMSGEHGVGYTLKNYMTTAFKKEELQLMSAIKKVFDPNNILNPGKIFPDHILT